MSGKKSTTISDFVKPGFEAVREAFVENFTHRHELGAACCIYYRGEKVVDLWGGIRNKATGAHLSTGRGAALDRRYI